MEVEDEGGSYYSLGTLSVAFYHGAVGCEGDLEMFCFEEGVVVIVC